MKFKASPATVYDLLADSIKHAAVTGRKATISRKVGGTGLVLAHRGVPKERIAETERAWREKYRSSIRACLADAGQEGRSPGKARGRGRFGRPQKG